MPAYGTNPALATVFSDPSKVSVKRLAWAFGCAKKGSDEEIALYRLLVERMEQVIAERRER